MELRRGVLGKGLAFAVLDDAALFEDGDLVATADGDEVVGDDDDGTVFDEAIDGALDHLLGAAVEPGGRLVEYEHSRPGEEYAGEGE